MSRENQFTPAYKIEEPYDKVQVPVIGKSYHLSWARKGARFILEDIIDTTYCNVYTGHTNNKTLKVKISDLRHCRGQKG